MNKALEFKGRLGTGTSYTHANLGNLYRVRGNYDKALEYYMEALDHEPETSDYTNGLNELARLYFDQGDLTKGFESHRLALRTLSEPTEDEDHQKLKLMREVNDILKKKCHQASEAVDLLYRETSEAAWPRDTQAWLTKLARILKLEAAS